MNFTARMLYYSWQISYYVVNFLARKFLIQILVLSFQTWRGATERVAAEEHVHGLVEEERRAPTCAGGA